MALLHSEHLLGHRGGTVLRRGLPHPSEGEHQTCICLRRCGDSRHAIPRPIRRAAKRTGADEVNEKFFETAEKRYDADESKRGTEDDCYFFDSVTGISFWSSERNVLYAQSRIKEDLFDGSEYATIPDLYMYMGVDIDAIDGSIFREFGWTNNGALPDVKIDAVMRDGRPIAVLHYRATYLNDVLPKYPPHRIMTDFEKDIDKTKQYVEDYDPDKKE